MLKGVLAHICFNVYTHHMPCIGHVIGCQGVNNPQKQVQTADSDYNSGCHGCQILHPLVCDIAQHQRKNQFSQCSQSRTE